MEKIIAVKDGGTEFLTNPQIIYNLNLGHLLVKFKSIQATNRNTAFAIYVPAKKPTCAPRRPQRVCDQILRTIPTHNEATNTN